MVNLHFIIYIILALIIIHFLLYFFNIDLFEIFDKKKNKEFKNNPINNNSDNLEVINKNINELENSLEELKEITSN